MAQQSSYRIKQSTWTEFCYVVFLSRSAARSSFFKRLAQFTSQVCLLEIKSFKFKIYIFLKVKSTRANLTAELLLLVQAAKEYIRSMKESKKSKGRRQPLSKLPRHHPLLVKDCISDDGKPCALWETLEWATACVGSVRYSSLQSESCTFASQTRCLSPSCVCIIKTSSRMVSSFLPVPFSGNSQLWKDD